MNNKIEGIYALHAESIYRYCVYKVGNQHEAEDICSEVFARFMAKQQSGEIADIKLWLIGFARNIIYSKYKATGKYEQVIDESRLEQMAGEEAGQVEQEMIDEEQFGWLRSEMQALNDIEREVIILKIWENMTFAQIAQLSDVNENSVKATYYRALDKLKDNMQKRERKYMIFTLPVLVAAISGLKTDFAIPSTLFNTVNLKIMDSTAQVTPLAEAGSGAASGFLQTAQAKIIAAVAAMVVVGSTAAGVVYVSNDNTPESTPTPIITPTAMVEASIAPTEMFVPTEAVVIVTQKPSVSQAPIAAQKQYKIVHTAPGTGTFTLEFSAPSDWEVVNVENNPPNGRTVTVTKNGYAIILQYIDATESESCSYSNDQYYLEPGSGPYIRQMGGVWTQINGVHSQFRRSITSSSPVGDEYAICRLYGGNFSDAIPFVATVRTLQGNPNPAMMQEVDGIIATFK